MSARDEGGAYARIRENLSELGLDAMAAGLPHWMSAVAAGEADFASAMLAMTSEEAEAKRRRGTDRKVRAAGFPFVKTLADFDFSFQPSIPRAVVDDLATLRFLDAAENVVLVGSPGVGKTHIAVALGVEAVRARKEVRFTDCAALVRDLKDASSRGILAKRLKYYAHATLLIIDELGYLDVDEEGADLLFQLVSARYEHRSTVITTNVAVGLWADVFGDAVTAAAIADRVCHHCTMLKITGRSYRMKDLLAEAADETLPGYERLKFLSIYCSNLDEFYMVRVGGLLDRALLQPWHTETITGLTPREQLRDTAPRIETIHIPVDKIREVIGSGGKVVRGIQDETGASIDIQEDGTIHIAAVEGPAGEAAKKMILDIVKEPEVGEEYEGEVVGIKDFGAFVKLTPGKDGLLHISRVANGRVGSVEDVLQLGDTVKVQVLEIDPKTGKISLDRLDKPDAPEGSTDNGGHERRERRDRNGNGHGDNHPGRSNRTPRRRHQS